MNSITPRDFQPISRWTDDTGAEKWDKEEPPTELVDRSTGREYPYQSEGWLRAKCSLLTIGAPIIHPFTSVANIVFRLFKLIIGYHLWTNINNGTSYSLKGRLKEVGWDLLRIVATPLALIGLILSPIYGIITPNNGRKLYATFERAYFGRGLIAPCFQPILD